jgi:hypothetical protein
MMKDGTRRALVAAFAIYVCGEVKSFADVNCIPRSSAGVDPTATKVSRLYRGLNFTAATTEAMVTLTPSGDYVDGSTGTSFTVTGGKRLVALNVHCATRNAGAAVQGLVVRLRVSASGAVTTSSPVLAECAVGTSSATANVAVQSQAQVSQGWPTVVELTGTQQLGVSQIGTATAGNDVVVVAYEY